MPFKSIEYNLEEELLDLEIRKSRLEQAVTSSEMFPDLTLGLKLTKFDVLITGLVITYLPHILFFFLFFF